MNTTHRPYHQSADQREREAILRNDRANTFAGRAQAEADDVRGRWAQINKFDVVGATPTPQYPAGPNWSVDPTGLEPPLGIDVNAVEPCGEKFEIDAMATSATGSHQPASAPRHDERGFVGSPLAGAKANASVDDPSRTGGAEAPTAVALLSADGEPPAINPKPRRA
jgi:hypothetical protein